MMMTVCGVNFQDSQSLPEGASVPALGLSNKAVFQGVKPDLREDLKMPVSTNNQYEEPYFKTVSVQGKHVAINCGNILQTVVKHQQGWTAVSGMPK